MMSSPRLRGLVCAAFFLLGSTTPLAFAQATPKTAAIDRMYFSQWPENSDPRTVGLNLARHFITAPHQYTKTLHYSETVAWYGAIEMSLLTKDKPLLADLDKRFQPLLGGDASRAPQSGHVDNSVYGALPLELYLAEGTQQYLTLGQGYADRQWSKPDAQGLSAETRFWIDDMYMITLLQVQAYRATKNPIYIQRAALEMSAYLDKLQQSNGLFYHAPDVPFFWGRGDGWMAAGMTELLRSLPENDPLRPRILKGYRAMMAALLKNQGKDGSWRQLIDDESSWNESSSSAMFTFAFVSGVRNGWLDAAIYGPAARKGWIALTGYIDQNNDVTQVCEGTNKLNSHDYYLQRRRRTGDFHGQAPTMWAAAALLR